MRGKRVVSICTTLLVMLLAIAGCGKKDNLVGKWVVTEEDVGGVQTIELFSDGTGILAYETSSYSCTWTAESGRLKVEIDTGIFGKSSQVVDYEVNSDTLILSDENGSYTYSKE